jgi:hypothetical protein
MDLPTLRQLRTFVIIVEAGGLTQAARALHLTQPAVSQQLRELERILGVRVLDRTATGLVPTAAGAAILTAARRTQAAAAEVAAIALACRSGEVGRVRLGTGATACIYLLPPILVATRRQMPGLEIVVETGKHRTFCAASSKVVWMQVWSPCLARSAAAWRVFGCGVTNCSRCYPGPHLSMAPSARASSPRSP